ncbi:MAG TPA: FISUMP domain-containing protein, partial [Longimicrobiales bacterium]|nr:FISUMP domain-containing protein [Longimicrobiales bacterium]
DLAQQAESGTLPKSSSPQSNPNASQSNTSALPSSVTKYAALAVDRTNGFYYGYAYDHPSIAEAESRALEEVKKRGGSGYVVLLFSGAACGAYRTMDGNAGTAYGWGVAPTQPEADGIATREAQKRSKGKTPTNYVWGCNSREAGPLKILKDEPPEDDIAVINIGSQTWTLNLNVTRFRDGTPILHTTTDAEWSAAGSAQTPAWRYMDNSEQNGYGKFYNWYAATDARGLCPAGFRLPGRSDYETLINYLGGPTSAGSKLKSRTGWRDGNGTDDFGFNGFPTGGIGSSGDTHGSAAIATYWTADNADRIYAWYFELYDGKASASERYPRGSGKQVRCVKN